MRRSTVWLGLAITICACLIAFNLLTRVSWNGDVVAARLNRLMAEELSQGSSKADVEKWCAAHGVLWLDQQSNPDGTAEWSTWIPDSFVLDVGEMTFRFKFDQAGRLIEARASWWSAGFTDL